MTEALLFQMNIKVSLVLAKLNKDRLVSLPLSLHWQAFPTHNKAAMSAGHPDVTSQIHVAKGARHVD